MKLCADCKYYKREIVQYHYGTDIKWNCYKNSEIDLVTGAWITGVDAYKQRAKVSSEKNRCGEAGIYWEKKQ